MPHPMDKEIIDFMEKNNLSARSYSVNNDPSSPVQMCQFIDRSNDRVLSLSDDPNKPVWGVAGESKPDALRKAFAVIKKVGIQREGTVQVPAKEYAALAKERDDLAAKLAAIKQK